MALTRRGFLKGLAATVAGVIVLPPTLEENAEAARRFWALDSTMVPAEPEWGMFGPYNSASSFAKWAEAYEARETPLIDTIHLSDTSMIRRGDRLRIVVPDELWTPPYEHVVIEAVLGHGLVSVRRS